MMDLRELARSIAEAPRGPVAHLVARSRELAASVPEDQREAVAAALLLVGLCLSDESGGAVNLLGMVGSELLNPERAGRR